MARMRQKQKTVQAPTTTENSLQVYKRLSRLEGINRIKLGPPRFKRSRNRGNGKNRNFNPNPSNGFDVFSTHVVRDVNAEGNIAEIPIRSKVSDREWIEYHSLNQDARWIRRMKNDGNRLRRKLRKKAKHGRSVRVAR